MGDCKIQHIWMPTLVLPIDNPFEINKVEQGGHHRHQILTTAGLLHAKEIEEKNEKAMHKRANKGKGVENGGQGKAAGRKVSVKHKKTAKQDTVFRYPLILIAFLITCLQLP